MCHLLDKIARISLMISAALVFLPSLSFAVAYVSETLTSTKGTFTAQITLEDPPLKRGENKAVLLLKANHEPLSGAHVLVTPWMPEMGHGSSESPTVADRGLGRYEISNIQLVMGGHWQLKLKVSKAKSQDEFVFDFPAEAPANKSASSQFGYEKSVARYQIPDVTLQNQDQHALSLKKIMDTNDAVVVSFLFTTCTTVCPVQASILADLQRKLKTANQTAHLVSISIDPLHDTPQTMKEYLGRFRATPGWDFLTGNPADIDKAMIAFDAYVNNKMDHRPLFLLRPSGSKEWVRFYGFVKSSELLKEFQL